ncbi:hypothetical protein Tco_0695912 [Tanacetum coccineum]
MSSPRPPEEFNSENPDAIIESFLHLLSPLRIVTLLWRRSIYFLLRMTRCHRALRMMTMTLKGISFFLEELLNNDSPSLPENESGLKALQL